MPANTSVWTFTQIAGDKKVLTLADHAAPHGRPRKKPVVETELSQRAETTYFTGDAPPTRHIFGKKKEPEKINGRLSDSYAGNGFARQKRREIEGFVGDGVSCIVTWDDLVSALCFIKRVKFGIESGSEMTYEIEYEVDADQYDGGRGIVPVAQPRGPQDLTNQIKQALGDMSRLTKPPGMKGSIFDSVSSLISSVNAVSSALYTAAGQIDSFANAPFQLINQVRAALDQFRTVVSSLRRTYDDLTVHAALENENANAQGTFWGVQAEWAVSSLEAIRLALEMERASVLAQQGNIQAIYTAQEGDTWDQISRVVYGGDAGRAGDIRDANGVAPGAEPVPGTAYMVPV